MKYRNDANRDFRHQGGTYGQEIGRSSNKEFRGMDEFIESDSRPPERREERWRDERDFEGRADWSRYPGLSQSPSRFGRSSEFDNSDRFSGITDQGYPENRFQGGLTHHHEWRHGEFTGKGPKGYRRSDERIREELCDRLTEHGQIDASDIDVAVESGLVTLTGWVSDRRSKRMTEDVCETTSGVTDVHNQLRVGDSKFSEPSGKMARPENPGKAKPTVAAV